MADQRLQGSSCIAKNFRKSTEFSGENSTKKSLQQILAYQKNKLACSLESLNSIKEQHGIGKEKKQVKLLKLHQFNDQKGVRHSYDADNVLTEKVKCERGYNNNVYDSLPKICSQSSIENEMKHCNRS